MRRIGKLAAGGLGVWLACAWTVGAIEEPDSPGPNEAGVDCGTKALYFLLRLEGRSTDPARIVAALDGVAAPSETKEPVQGRSMRDLRDAAGRLGIKLDGVRWPSGPTPPDRPVIAFLDRKPHGHFVTVRPVGHSGKLVQVFDGETDPKVIDAAKLIATSEWTGLILAPRRANWLARLAGVGVAVALMAWPIARYSRSRRPLAGRVA